MYLVCSLCLTSIAFLRFMEMIRNGFEGKYHIWLPHFTAMIQNVFITVFYANYSMANKSFRRNIFARNTNVREIPHLRGADVI